MSQNVVGPFSDDAVEAINRFNNLSQTIVVNQFRIAKDTGFLPEQTLDGIGVFADLLKKFVARVQKTQAVIIGLGQKFYAAGIGQRIKLSSPPGSM